MENLHQAAKNSHDFLSCHYSYLNMQEPKLWDKITGQHKDTPLNQMIQVIAQTVKLILICLIDKQVEKQIVMVNHDAMDSGSLLNFSATSLMRPYDI